MFADLNVKFTLLKKILFKEFTCVTESNDVRRYNSRISQTLKLQKLSSWTSDEPARGIMPVFDTIRIARRELRRTWIKEYARAGGSAGNRERNEKKAASALPARTFTFPCSLALVTEMNARYTRGGTMVGSVELSTFSDEERDKRGRTRGRDE